MREEQSGVARVAAGPLALNRLGTVGAAPVAAGHAPWQSGDTN